MRLSPLEFTPGCLISAYLLAPHRYSMWSSLGQMFDTLPQICSLMEPSRIVASPPYDSPRSASVYAVIVAFNPDEESGIPALRIATQLNGCIVVDNSTDQAATSRVAILAKDAGAELIGMNRNAGVAAALNKGIERALTMGAQWILTLDQDTTPLPGMVEYLLQTFRDSEQQLAREKRPIGLLGLDPRRFRPYRGRPASSIPDLGFRECVALITSGTLISATAYRSIGPFREDLFIDHVDTEYCLRARALGFAVIAAGRQLMEYRIGIPSTHRIGSYLAVTSNHPAIRRFYMSRNLVMLIAKYFRKETRFIFSLIFAWVKSFSMMLVFEKQRLPKTKAIFTGLLSGLHMGRHNI